MINISRPFFSFLMFAYYFFGTIILLRNSETFYTVYRLVEKHVSWPILRYCKSMFCKNTVHHTTRFFPLPYLNHPKPASQICHLSVISVTLLVKVCQYNYKGLQRTICGISEQIISRQLAFNFKTMCFGGMVTKIIAAILPNL